MKKLLMFGIISMYILSTSVHVITEGGEHENEEQQEHEVQTPTSPSDLPPIEQRSGSTPVFKTTPSQQTGEQATSVPDVVPNEPAETSKSGDYTRISTEQLGKETGLSESELNRLKDPSGIKTMSQVQVNEVAKGLLNGIPSVSFSLSDVLLEPIRREGAPLPVSEITKRETLLEALNKIWTGARLADLPLAVRQSLQVLLDAFVNSVKAQLANTEESGSERFRPLTALMTTAQEIQLRNRYEGDFGILNLSIDNVDVNEEAVETAFVERIREIEAKYRESRKSKGPNVPVTYENELKAKAVVREARQRALEYLARVKELAAA